MTEIEKHIGRLFSSELQFRLASATRLAVTMDKQPLDVPLEWSHGKHKVSYEEVALRKDQADFAAWNLHRSATFLMAVAMKDAIKIAVSDLKNFADANTKSAYQISRLIRNSFAHSPFDPVWSIDPNCRDRVFNVEDIITLDTTDLQGVSFDWKHYGGPLALLMLCRYVRFEILKDERKPRKVIPMPKEIYYQQGDLIFKKLREENASE
jgi:hypothetical protein